MKLNKLFFIVVVTFSMLPMHATLRHTGALVIGGILTAFSIRDTAVLGGANIASVILSHTSSKNNLLNSKASASTHSLSQDQLICLSNFLTSFSITASGIGLMLWGAQNSENTATELMVPLEKTTPNERFS